MTDAEHPQRERPERIYLEPEPSQYDEGPMWCQDQIEDDWTEYVRADLVDRPQVEPEPLEMFLCETHVGAIDLPARSHCWIVHPRSCPKCRHPSTETPDTADGEKP